MPETTIALVEVLRSDDRCHQTKALHNQAEPFRCLLQIVQEHFAIFVDEENIKTIVSTLCYVVGTFWDNDSRISQHDLERAISDDLSTKTRVRH